MGYNPARSTIISATLFADINGKSSAVKTLPASPAFNSTSPDLQVVSAPSGKDPSNSSGVSIGNFAPANAPTICACISVFTLMISPPVYITIVKYRNILNRH